MMLRERWANICTLIDVIYSLTCLGAWILGADGLADYGPGAGYEVEVAWTKSIFVSYQDHD
jgi:hypothetical protein